jgi:hypothetical protein
MEIKIDLKTTKVNNKMWSLFFITIVAATECTFDNECESGFVCAGSGCRDGSDFCLEKGMEDQYSSIQECTEMSDSECARVYSCLDTDNMCFWNGTVSECEYQGNLINQECLTDLFSNGDLSVNGTFDQVLFARQDCLTEPTSLPVVTETQTTTSSPVVTETTSSSSVVTETTTETPTMVSRDIITLGDTYNNCDGGYSCVTERQVIIRENYMCANVRSIEVPVFVTETVCVEMTSTTMVPYTTEVPVTIVTMTMITTSSESEICYTECTENVETTMSMEVTTEMSSSTSIITSVEVVTGMSEPTPMVIDIVDTRSVDFGGVEENEVYASTGGVSRITTSVLFVVLCCFLMM